MKKRLLPFFAVITLILAMTATSCKKEAKNGIPTISSLAVSPASVNANGIVSVNVTAVDPDNDPLTYNYTVTGGAITGNGASASWTAPSIEGAHSVTVVVSDGKGGQVTGNGALTVMPAVTQITGTASFPVGIPANLVASKVSIYTSFDNWNNYSPIKFVGVTGSGASVSFTMTGVSPGNYYLDVWSDNDASGDWSAGDFVGWYGSGGLGAPTLTEFQIGQGQTFNCTINMFIF
ncbi:MAG: hypothetical protein CVT92_03585 [Bacteroidetes bacterium HGW-Bacteroidetes-1]|jgi:hypothetical protein|nr:MAG: hypothetical protein CVT92_03585 [Bacteroidetes bacterium HGW-Bacteroidetes-1]